MPGDQDAGARAVFGLRDQVAGDELGQHRHYVLSVELMGKNSNIILYGEDDRNIIGCIGDERVLSQVSLLSRATGPSLTETRQLLPRRAIPRIHAQRLIGHTVIRNGDGQNRLTRRIAHRAPARDLRADRATLERYIGLSLPE